MFCGFIREIAQGRDHAIETFLRPNGSPIRENTDNARAGVLRNFKSAFGKPRLVFIRVLGGENILLEPGIDIWCIGENTLEQRRGDGNDLESALSDHFDRLVQFFIRQIDDVLAENYAQLGASHPDLTHRADGGREIGRELVGNGGGGEDLGHEIATQALDAGP